MTPQNGNVQLLSGDRNLLLEFAPSQGGRITRLRTHTLDWLLPDNTLSLAAQHFPAEFVREGLGGWDECIPTVAACVVRGRRFNDHGDAWQLPWQRLEGDWWGVQLTSIPLLFKRQISPTTSGFILKYQVENRGIEAHEFLWSSHPLFDAEGISLDFGDQEWASSDRLGCTFKWDPLAPLAGIPFGTGIKVFMKRPLAVSQVRLTKRIPTAAPTTLELSWDPQKIQHLGLWLDNRECSRMPTIAVEPCFASGDSLAKRIDEVPRIAPNQIIQWHILINRIVE